MVFFSKKNALIFLCITIQVHAVERHIYIKNENDIWLIDQKISTDVAHEYKIKYLSKGPGITKEVDRIDSDRYTFIIHYRTYPPFLSQFIPLDAKKNEFNDDARKDLFETDTRDGDKIIDALRKRVKSYKIPELTPKEKEQQERERLERERLEKEQQEREQQERERLERERLEKEQQERERLEKERQERERLEKEQQERERLEKEQQERERLEKERLKKERQEQERLEREEKKEARESLSKLAHALKRILEEE